MASRTAEPQTMQQCFVTHPSPVLTARSRSHGQGQPGDLTANRCSSVLSTSTTTTCRPPNDYITAS